jgi:outer membrane protein TolC
VAALAQRLIELLGGCVPGRTALPRSTLTWLLACAFATSARAAEEAPVPSPLGLRELQEIARRVDPRALIAYAQFEAAQGKRSEADWAWFPKFETTLGGGGPTGESRLKGGPDDNIQNITDCTRAGIWGCSRWGVQVRGEVTAQLPIYTFGKLSAGRAAAAHGVEARAALLARDRNLVGADVAKAYWTYQTTRDAQRSIADMRDRLLEVRKTATQLLADESDQVTTTDLARLELLETESEVSAAQALAGQRLAEVALKLLVGREPEEPLEVQRESPGPPPVPPPVARLLEQARRDRPEIKAAAENVAARLALVELERARLWPDVAIVGGASFAYTTNAENLSTPFVNNPNSATGYVALAMRGTFDVPVKLAKIRQVEADLHEAQATQVGAERLVRLEIEKALADLASARSRAEQYRIGAGKAKAMLVKGSLAFDSGLGGLSDLFIDSYLYSRSEGERLKAFMDGQLAWVALEVAVGAPISAPPAGPPQQTAPATP